jgi:hypothetical protein
MTENVEVVNDKTLTDKVVTFGRETFYMGLGVVSVAEQTVKVLVKHGKEYRQMLVERGEKMAEENRGRVNELVDMPQSVAKDTVKKANDTLDKYSEQVLSRIHVPTVDQIETMTKKVGSVERKLDKVIKENAAAQQI